MAVLDRGKTLSPLFIKTHSPLYPLESKSDSGRPESLQPVLPNN